MSVVGPRWAHVRAVLFDLDGTLIDSAPDLAAAANAMRAARSLPALPLEQYRPHGGSGARGMLAQAFATAPGAADYEALKHEFLDRYEALMFDNTRPFANVPALLERLQATGLPWGIVTNKAERFARPLAAALDLRAGALVGGDTTPHTKPHPAPLLEAARRLGVPTHACLYVGDDERDVLAGRAAGMATAAAAWGYLGHQVDPLSWNAEILLPEPLALLNHLGLA